MQKQVKTQRNPNFGWEGQEHILSGKWGKYVQRPQKKLKQIPNQEDIYRLLAEENWPALLSFIWENPGLITSDPITKHAIDTSETIFFSKLETETDKEKLINTLESFYILQTNNKYKLSDDRFRIVIIELVKLLRDSHLEQAYRHARHYPDDELCRSVIKQYEDSLPKSVAHSQSSTIRVTENKNLADIDGRRTLFKSKQEKEFFDAVREAFPMYIVYPNVALSSIVEYELVKDHLSPNERTFFFKGTVDCVIFDYHRELYQPKYFFELDSPYHDEPEQKLRDEYKDNIMSAAGQRLFRVRRVDTKQSRGDFILLIRDLIEKDTT